MNESLNLFHRVTRNLRWYLDDVVTAVTGRARPFHLIYGRDRTETNPATGAAMLTATRDVHGYRYSTIDQD
jgi:hypothetical protein